MHKWTYTILNIVFFVPVIILIWVKYRRIIYKNKLLILLAGLFGFVSFFIVDPIATKWGAWSFDYSQTLGIFIGKSVLEELIWIVLVCMVLAVAVARAAEKEESGSHFRISDLFKRKY